MMARPQLQDLPSVVLLILCTAFLVLLILRTEREGASLFPIRFYCSSGSAEDPQSRTEFEWETELEMVEKKVPLGQQHLVPRATTKHPLEVIYSHDYTFLLNEPDKCLETSPFLVLLVTTEPQGTAKREAIRQTWGNESLVPGVSVLHLFLTGVHPRFGSLLQNLLEEESAIYRDLVQQDFLDTYNNLTLKTLMGMEWVAKFCPNATYVVKADSDIFLNVGRLVSLLLQPHLPPKKDYITGRVYKGIKPIRSKAYKWYMPKEVYPNDTYPTYWASLGYILSGDLAKKIYHVATTIKVVRLEDVFVGICVYELGVSVTDSPWGLFRISKPGYDKCTFSRLVAVHRYTPEQLLAVWPDFQDQNKTCGP